MGEIKHLEAVAEKIATDVADYVRSHPQYTAMVQALGEKALAALAAEAGI